MLSGDAPITIPVLDIGTITGVEYTTRTRKTHVDITAAGSAA